MPLNGKENQSGLDTRKYGPRHDMIRYRTVQNDKDIQTDIRKGKGTTLINTKTVTGIQNKPHNIENRDQY